MAVQTEALMELGEHIASQMPDAVRKFDVRVGELNVYAERDQIVPLLDFLKRNQMCMFEMMIDLCGVDYPERSQRFEVVYHLLSMRLNQRIRVKISTDEDTPVPSIVELHRGTEKDQNSDVYG